MNAWVKGHLGWLLGLLILIIICIFLLYSWINALVSLDYARQGEKYERRRAEVLQNLLQETGKKMSRSEMKRFVVEHFKGNVKEEQGRILVDGIILEFNGESLAEVKFLE